MAIRSRSFSVPQGTVLPNGFVVPERISVTLPYNDQYLTPGQAQKQAGRAALDQLSTRYGVQPKDIGGFAGLQRSTKVVQAATPARAARPGEAAAPARARGGRKPTPVRIAQTTTRGQHVYIDIAKMPKSWTPAQRFQAVRGAITLAFKGDAVTFAVIQTGQTSLADETGYEPPTSEEFGGDYIFQSPAFTSLAAWDRKYPDARALEQASSIALDGTGQLSLCLRIEP